MEPLHSRWSNIWWDTSKWALDEKVPYKQTVSCHHSASMPQLSSIIHSSLSSGSLSVWSTIAIFPYGFCHDCVRPQGLKKCVPVKDFLESKAEQHVSYALYVNSSSVYLSVDLPMHACNIYLLSCCYQALPSIILKPPLLMFSATNFINQNDSVKPIIWSYAER